jgi:hypothetical protein
MADRATKAIKKYLARVAAAQHVARPNMEESIVVSLAREGCQSCTTTFVILASKTTSACVYDTA